MSYDAASDPNSEYVRAVVNATNGNQIPRTFLDEFVEVCGDIQLDLKHSIKDLDEEVGRRVKASALELFKLAGGDPARTLDNIMSAMLWMFMAGREHAVRGFPAPVAKADPDNDGWVPDTVAGLFE